MAYYCHLSSLLFKIVFACLWVVVDVFEVVVGEVVVEFFEVVVDGFRWL